MKTKSRLLSVMTIFVITLALLVLMLSLFGADTTFARVAEATASKADANSVHQIAAITKYQSESAIYIIVLQDDSLVAYKGGISGLAATNPRARGERKLDVDAPDSVAYLDYLAQKRGEAVASMGAALGHSVPVIYEYKAALNGLAVELTVAEAAIVASLPEVKSIEREMQFELHTDAGPSWIGAPSIWDGSATGGLPSTMGEGIVVGVIDTGIDPWNPSFADVGGDGYDHTNPWGAGTYVGVCDSTDPSYDPTFPCNDKLIGAWGYASVNGGDPRDSDGHGSHTSSTAAGNFVYDTVISTTTAVFSASISGVAPHANVVMYAACCAGSALMAARDQVVMDGVDVVNYSIGATVPTANPWTSAESQQWLNVRDAGIFVATSAGNSGPDDGTVFLPGDIPWLTAVAASTHNRTFLNSLTVYGDSSGPLTLDGESMTGPLDTPAEVVLSRWFTAGGTIDSEDARLCADGVFSGTVDFNGAIVVCERGIYGRVAKGQTVLDAGAGGYILAQPDEFGGGPGSLASDPHVLPAVHIDYYAYQDLLNYMASASGIVTGTIAGSVIDINDAHGDILASFSSRGPNSAPLLPDILKPQVSAPGRAIWAAYHQGDGGDGTYTYNVIQGTSMASPHVAGAGALLLALHPEWTPSMVESALATTADTSVLNDDGLNPATPFGIGSGRVELRNAAEAGLVLDVTTVEFLAANPNIGGEPKDLNLPSMADSNCMNTCSWTRTVSSTLSVPMTWTASVQAPAGMLLTVNPTSFVLPPFGTQEIEITADVSAFPPGQWEFGQITLTPDALSGTLSCGTTIDFNDGIPSDWTVVDNEGTGVRWGDLAACGEAGNFTDGAGDAACASSDVFGMAELDTELLSNAFNLPVGGPSLGYLANYQNFQNMDFLDVDISSDGGGSWTNLLNWNADHGNFRTTPGEAVNIDLSAYAGMSNLRLRWHYYDPNANDSDWYAQIDDVSLTCSAVSAGLSVPQAHLPVAVAQGGEPPAIEIPADVESTQSADVTIVQPFTITNNGGNDLTWNIFEDASAQAPAFLSDEAANSSLERQVSPIPLEAAESDVSFVSRGGVVADGGFEAGSPNPFWNESSTNFGTPLCDLASCGLAGAHTGSWFAWFGGINSLETGSVDQDITIPLSSTTASFWLQMQSGGSPGFMNVEIDNNVVFSVTEADAGTYASYTEVMLDISAFADGGMHNLEFFSTVNAGPGTTNFFVDDIEIASSGVAACDGPDDIAWLSVSPTSGTTMSGTSDIVDLTFDSTGLSAGVYTGTLCVSSNDPVDSLVSAPVTLTVLAQQPPEITVEPTSLSANLAPDNMSVQTLSISNMGDADLEWTIDEAEPPVSLDVGQSAAAAPGSVAELDLFSSPTVGVEAASASQGLSQVEGSVALVLDDGSAENNIGIGGGQWVWLNRFTPDAAEYPFQLEEVHVLFNPGVGVDIGELIDIYVYEDTDGDGDPGTGAVHLGSIHDAEVQAVDGTTFSTYTLTMPIALSGPGDVLIAVVNRTAGINAGEFPAALDETASQGRSWVGAYAGDPDDPPILPASFFGIIDSFGFPGNFMIRGLGTPIGCNAPSDLPWLSVSPTSGTTISGTTSTVEVTFDSTGLSTGTYSGTLCINSNDLATPRIEVPVSMTVGDPFYDVSIGPDQAMTDTFGATVTYMLEVMNTGNVPDTFDLSVSGNTWMTTLSESSVSLGIGESATVEVSVRIPASVANGSMDTAMVTATSQGDGAITDSATLVTTAVASGPPVVYLPVVIKD